MLTSFGARTITLRTCGRPARARTAGSASASGLQLGLGDVRRDLQPGPDLALDLHDRGHRRPRPAAPRRRPASRRGRRSARGPAAPTSPRRCTARPATAGSPPPRRPRGRPGPPGRQPESIALRVALTSSMIRATTTLNRWASTSSAASCTVRWVTLRSAASPPSAGDARRAGRRRRASRQARCRNRSDPAGDMSAQSMSSSGGPGEDQGQPHGVDAELGESGRPGRRRCPATCSSSCPG